MSLDFPNNPTQDDTFVINGSTYIYDSNKWKISTTPAEGSNSQVIEYSVVNSNYTAESGDGVLADTSGGSINIALPATPSIGDSLIIADAADTWDTDSIIIQPNGSTIEGSGDDLVGDIKGVSITFVYDGTTWQIYPQLSASALSGGGATLVNQVTSSSTFYPTFSDSLSGQFTTAYVSDTGLYYQPSTGTLNATSFNSLSDVRKKKNIKTIENAINKTTLLRGASFTYTQTEQDSIGVIAQEVEEVIPEIVSTDEDGYKSVSYGNLVGVLIEAIKEQQNQINYLKDQIESK